MGPCRRFKSSTRVQVLHGNNSDKENLWQTEVKRSGPRA
jgi:hypothetical protein